MSIFDIFFAKKPPTASIAKERLQIVLAHERVNRSGPDFLPLLQRDLLNVVRKYIEVDEDVMKVQLGKQEGTSVLEINIELDNAKVKERSEPAKPAVAAANGGTAGAAAPKPAMASTAAKGVGGKRKR
ncbi:MAG TPA: cell division topological specificity factor MinE [Stellaceae bacterium]